MYSQNIEGCIVETKCDGVFLVVHENVETDAQYQIFVKSGRHALHDQNLVLNTMTAVSVMLSLTENVATMSLTHFLEDEFREVEKILLCRDQQNSSVCVHQQHRIHQYVFISNMWHAMLQGDVT
jgi:hypothetical protein